MQVVLLSLLFASLASKLKNETNANDHKMWKLSGMFPSGRRNATVGVRDERCTCDVLLPVSAQ